VVTKSVRITEEVVIQREGSDHVKTLKDKVRRQQVEVERVATNEPVSRDNGSEDCRPSWVWRPE
jgi:stress response protein YsnF